jgi:hypothetical protein
MHYQTYYTYKCNQIAERVAVGDDDKTLFPIRRSIAGVLHNMGSTFYHDDTEQAVISTEDLDTAQQHYDEARVLNEEIGNDQWRARNLFGLYTVTWRKGVLSPPSEKRTLYFEQALEYVQVGEALCRKVQQDFFLCYMLSSQATILPLLGQQERALPILKEGFQLACPLEHRTYVIKLLKAYYYQALYEKRWEEATQFLGATIGQSKRWDIALSDADSHLWPQVNLREILGVTRYELLYEAGAQSSLEALQTLAAGFPETSPVELD